MSEALWTLSTETVVQVLRAGEVSARPLRALQALRSEALRSHRDKLRPEVVWNIEEGLKLTAAELARAEAKRAVLRRKVLSFFETYDVLITPAAPVEPFPMEQNFVVEIEGEKLDTYLDWLALGYAVSVVGCPAISIPCGLSQAGLPVGLQLIGQLYAEADLLSHTAWFDAELSAALSSRIKPRSPT
jgi:amidase